MWISWRPAVCIHILTLPNAIVTDRKARHKSNSGQVAVEHGHCHPYIQGSPAHWELIGRSPWPPRRLLYRPAVFFRHVRLNALTLPQANGRSGFQKCYYFCFLHFLKQLRVLNCVTWNCGSREVPVVAYNEMSKTCSAHWGWTQGSRGRSSGRRMLVLEDNNVATV
jgi:hypothetical protein